MLTDTHCHIFKENYDNIDEILANLEANNIKRIIINGYNLETNQEVLALTKKYPNVYGSLGIHPNYIDETKDKIIDFIKENINQPKIIAIGEIGLDYYHSKDIKNEQITCFKELLTLAEENNKPVIIHNRDATEDLINILKQHKLKGIMHCFNGSYETAKEYIKMGYKLGIGGIITFKNAKLGEIIEKLSVKDILLETDSPYITPEPYRKYQNEPKYLSEVAKKVAEIYEITDEKLLLILEENLAEIFDF